MTYKYRYRYLIWMDKIIILFNIYLFILSDDKRLELFMVLFKDDSLRKSVTRVSWSLRRDDIALRWDMARE